MLRRIVPPQAEAVCRASVLPKTSAAPILTAKLERSASPTRALADSARFPVPARFPKRSRGLAWMIRSVRRMRSATAGSAPHGRSRRPRPHRRRAVARTPTVLRARSVSPALVPALLRRLPHLLRRRALRAHRMPTACAVRSAIKASASIRAQFAMAPTVRATCRLKTATRASVAFPLEFKTPMDSASRKGTKARAKAASSRLLVRRIRAASVWCACTTPKTIQPGSARRCAARTPTAGSPSSALSM